MKRSLPKFSDARLLHGIHEDVERAFDFALLHHEKVKQVRKYTEEPYIYHPLEVASVAVSECLDKSKDIRRRVAIAGLLHDTVEDTEATYTQIMRLFGEQAARDVFWLSEPVGKEKGNRDTRHMLTRSLLAAAPHLIQGVKLVDMYCNLQSIGTHDPNFAITYAKEKKAVVAFISDEAFELFPHTTERLHAVIEELLRRE